MASAVFMASGKAWATPWSVMAMAFCPHLWACLMRAAAGVMPSVSDILVCRWSSTRFSGASSTTSTWSTVAMARARITFSRSYLSYSRAPRTSRDWPAFSLSRAWQSPASWRSFTVVEPV